MKAKEALAIFPFFYLLILLFQLDLSLLEDLGRHLKVGEIVAHCMCVPTTNLFSYVAGDFPIVSHEWLSELVFYGLANIFGLSSLLYLKMVVFLIAFGILYYLVRKQTSFFWAITISIPGISFLATRIRVRPEMFSYMFISIFFFLIYKFRKTKKFIFLYPLPLIELLWVNMHIFFIVGIIIYALFLFDEILIHKKYNIKLIIIGILLIITTLFNPSFIKGALLPFTIFSNYDLVVEENFNTFTTITNLSNSSTTLYIELYSFIFLAFLFIALSLTRIKNKEFFYTLTGLFGTILGIHMVRNISLFTMLALVPLGNSLSVVSNKLRSRMNLDKYTLQTIKVVVIGLLFAFVYINISELIHYNQLVFGYVPFAEKGTDFIIANQIKGPILNNYRIGNYLIYRLYPQQKVFVDARPEDYPPGFFSMYNTMLANNDYFQKQMDKYHFNAIVFGVPDESPNSRSFLLSRLNSNQWVPVYADGNVTILLYRNVTNANLIKKYQLNIH